MQPNKVNFPIPFRLKKLLMDILGQISATGYLLSPNIGCIEYSLSTNILLGGTNEGNCGVPKTQNCLDSL